MTQAWALVSPNNNYRVLYTNSIDEHPADAGHAEECIDVAVWPIEQMPREELGEYVDYNTGEFKFDSSLSQPGRDAPVNTIISQIKAKAQELILRDYPLWKQLNDMDLPSDDEGAIARKARRDEIRAWSDILENRVRTASSADELQSVTDDILLGI